jgi:outer membrane protein OmpA-like peptidoglycan-associated protein
MPLCNNILAQINSNISSQPTINYKSYPLTKLIFEDSSYKCGHYDSFNNVLYNCWGSKVYQPKNIREMISDTMCCRLQDLDGDGVDDGEDRCVYEKGPASNYGCPVIDQKIIRIHYPSLRTVFFTANSSDLSNASIEALKNSVAFLKEWPKLKINVEGHTDNLGSDKMNRKLSLYRIKAVRHYLLSSGIDKNRITYTIYLGKYPIADPTTKTGRAMNRRVEFSLYE